MSQRNSRRSSVEANTARRLNGGIVTRAHEQFVSELLGIDRFLPNGPDLLNDEWFGEVKSCLVGNFAHGNKSWTGLAHQQDYGMQYFPRRGFVAAMYYATDCSYIHFARLTTSADVERHIISREIFLIPWSFMTDSISVNKRYNHLVYLSCDDLPAVEYSYEEGKAIVHICEGLMS